MYRDNNLIINHDSQVLSINCQDEENSALLINDISQRIYSYSCNSTFWRGGSWIRGLTYHINNCRFTFNEFKSIIDSIAERFLECKDHILNVLHNTKHYLSYIDFSNNEQNPDTSLSIDGMSYAVGKIHNVLQKFYNNSPNTTNILINFANNGVMINDTKKLLKNCVSMVAEQGYVVDGGRLLKDHNIIDYYFDIRGNSSGVYRTKCLFDTNDSKEILTSSLAASLGGMNIVPVVGVVMCITIGIVATYIYNKNYRSNYNNEDYPNGGTELEEYNKVETSGESLTEYYDII